MNKFGIKIPLLKFLSSVHPKHEWLPWKFQHEPVPKGFWGDLSNQRKFIEWATIELEIKEMNDWYKVILSVIKNAILFKFFKGFYKYRWKWSS